MTKPLKIERTAGHLKVWFSDKVSDDAAFAATVQVAYDNGRYSANCSTRPTWNKNFTRFFFTVGL